LPLPAGPKTAPCLKLSTGKLASRAGVIAERSRARGSAKGAATSTGAATSVPTGRIGTRAVAFFGVVLGRLAPALLAFPLVFLAFLDFFYGIWINICPPTTCQIEGVQFKYPKTTGHMHMTLPI